jgi:hypothetical protein
MKKTTFLKTAIITAVAFIFSLNSNSQTVELTAAYGYQFGSKSNFGFSNSIKINDGDQYSFTIGVDMFKGIMTEVTWIRQSSDITLRYQGETDRLTDLNMDWIMIGASKYLTKDKLRPFIGTGVGAAIFNASNENQDILDRPIDTKWYLAVSMKAGINYMFNEKWGLNVQGNLMVPIQWGGVYFGGGGPGVTGTSNILIGGFSGGLVYRLN